MKRFAAVLILYGMVSTACRHTPIIPESPAISFSSDIQPIIAANCQMDGCHGNSNGGKEEHARSLTSYNDIMNNGAIEPYNAHNSDLYERIIDAPGSDLMPPSRYNPLPKQQLLKIYLWIMQGAKNN